MRYLNLVGLIFELMLIFMDMLELLEIKKQLEGLNYTNTDSLFELRLLLMEAASILTRKHISNAKQRKDVKMSALLVRSFDNIRSYFYIIETTKRGHEDCFNTIQNLVVKDITNLISLSDTQDYKIIPLQNTSLGIAK